MARFESDLKEQHAKEAGFSDYESKIILEFNHLTELILNGLVQHSVVFSTCILQISNKSCTVDDKRLLFITFLVLLNYKIMLFSQLVKVYIVHVQVSQRLAHSIKYACIF